MSETTKNWLITVLILVLFFGGASMLWRRAQQRVERAHISVVDVHHAPVPFVDVQVSHVGSTYMQSQGTHYDGRVAFGGSTMPTGEYQVEIRSSFVLNPAGELLYSGTISLGKRMQDITIRLGNVQRKTIIQYASQGTELPATPMTEILTLEPYNPVK